MSINFLKGAKYIRNYSLCRYDSRSGYTTAFTNNGDVDGWDIYNNIYMYGSWNSVLFGSTYNRECYIGRNDVFLSLPADKYYHIEFIMKVVDENPTSNVPTLTKGKIAWMRIEDSEWSSDRELEFDIKETGLWKYYKINMGPKQWWQGEINNIRFYPFVDAKEGDKFFIKFIKITSETDWTCNNTQCSKYSEYVHPCPWTGDAGYVEAETSKKLYTTISGVNSDLTLDINGYGEESFDIGNNLNIRGIDLSKIIGSTLSTVNIGGYSYVEVLYTDNDRMRITSGTVGGESSVNISYSKAAEELGFYDLEGNPTYTVGLGTVPATGFDYASTRHLSTYELNRLVDSDMSVAYVHNPNQFSVEGGRRDFNEIGISKLISELDPEEGYKSFDNIGKTLIDLSHRIDNNGKLTHFWVFGRIYDDSKLKVLRPHNNGSFTVVASVLLYEHIEDRVYTTKPIVYKLDCDILVNKGDLLGIYNTDVYVGATIKDLPEATFCQYSGDVSGKLEKTSVYSYGVGGFSFYARGDLTQNNTILEIDMGYRLNVSEFKIFGQELSNYFEFNIASCLDLNWSVNLFGNSHNHQGTYLTTNESWTTTHQNISYGHECLDDSVVTADNGLQGSSYGSDNGLATFGQHAYFYVNGDAEWLYSRDCGDPAEFCDNQYASNVTGFTKDTIEFTLTFPNESEYEIHKSSMYFKELNNFRSFELSYYNGAYYSSGNAQGTNEYTRIPRYNEISLNGAAYPAGTNSDIDSYLGQNPTSGVLDTSSHDQIISYISSKFLDWTILEHEFDPIKCKGFRIYCTEHYSTKITELELYARVLNDASLLDNIIIEFSDYGEVWRTSDFELIDGGISTFIGGTPRYFRLYIESQAEFYINEIDVKVTDQTYIAGGDVLLLDEAKQSVINKSQSLDIINTYDKPFDLTIDVPRSVSLMDSIIYWNKLSEESHISNAEIGPGGILYKSDDFPLTAYHGQIANNVPCYGLVNLIHDKTSYYTYDGVGWNTYGTLASGISVDFYNQDYAGFFKHAIEFDPVSAKYLKLCCLTVGSVFNVKSILVYFNNELVAIKQLYDNEDCGTSILTNEFLGDTLPFSDTQSIGIGLYDVDPVDKIVLLMDRDTNVNTRLYTSSNNISYYFNDDIVSNVSDNTVQFVIDLENRHSLDFIRSYGDAINNYEKGTFTTAINTSFSNTAGAIEDAIFNSTKDDCRWLSLNINCASTTPEGIAKIGIYSNIEKAYCIGGGYNHTWDSLGTNLTNYFNPINIAIGADVSATTDYLFDYYPTNAVDGIDSEYKLKYCWGFEKGTNPKLYVDFGKTYLINKIVLHHGYHPDNETTLNKHYTFSVDNTVSGTNYIEVLNQQGVSSNDTKTHEFEPVYARRAILEILDFYTMRVYTLDEDNNNNLKYASFLREIEVYTYTDYGNVNSETYPVVCVNLQDRFNVVDHKLLNDTYNSNTNWSNDEQFFRYSDNITDDPKKVSYTLQGNYVDEYYSAVSSGDVEGEWTYLFDMDIFLPQGNHLISWDSYYAENVDEISIELSGDETINLYATNYGIGWVSQTGELFVKNNGHFVIKARQHLDKDNNWGARNVRIYRSQGYSKWLSVKRDTATDYSYDNDSLKFGIDYLSSIQVYGDEKYNLTEYDWWWESNISTLTKSLTQVTQGKYSLYVEYPTSSGVDVIQFRPGDTFGVDTDWAVYDLFQFNWWIEDINKLDTTFGNILLGGGKQGLNEYYYSWDINEISLTSGWNSISLIFDDASSTYIEGERTFSKFLERELDLKKNEEELSNLYIRYKGKGNNFNMAFDTFNIKRNTFDTPIKFDNGLCLTGNDLYVIPISNLTLDKGTIEFGAKLGMDTFGRDAFGEMYGGTLFTLTNNNNDIIALRINPTYWFEIIYGNIRDQKLATIMESTESMTIDRNTVLHMALVWSRDGSETDNGQTLRFYINNHLILSSTTTWDVEDTKLSFLKLGGGIIQSSKIHSNFSNFFYNNIKIYNYCKEEFNMEKENIDDDYIYAAENFMEISKDDVDFHSIGSEDLPFVYEQVPSGDKVTVYVRANKNKQFSSDNSTAQVIIDWLTTV